MANIEAIKKLSEPNEEFAAFIAANPIPPSNWHDIATHKRIRDETDAQKLAALGPPPPEIQESFHSIPMRDNHSSSLKIFKPTTPPPSGSPLVVLIFGGGFCVGSNNQLTAISRVLSQKFGATVVNISYRLAPEWKFPVGVQDAWDSLLWISSNATGEILGADPSKAFVVGGVSAGANLTAVIAQQYLHQNKTGPAITGLWLSVPLLFANKDMVPEKYREEWISHEQNANVPGLDKDAIEAITEHLAAHPESEWYSPYNFNAGEPHRGLPKTYVQVDGMDPLRDDGLIHEKVLRERGVETRLTVWPGLPHAHFAFFPMLKCGKLGVMDTIEGLAWLLGKV